MADFLSPPVANGNPLKILGWDGGETGRVAQNAQRHRFEKGFREIGLLTGSVTLSIIENMKTIFGLILGIWCSASCFASSPSSIKDKPKEEVQARWKECVQLHSSAKTKKIVFAEMAKEGDKTEKWKLISDSVPVNEANEVADLYFDTAGNLLYSEIRGAPGSGDHSYKVEYCFRKGGELAFIVRTFTTSQGFPDGVREERRIWIGEHQKLIDDEIKVFDLTSGDLQKKKDRNYFQPDSMGWKTLPDAPEKLTAKAFLSRFPAFKL